MKNLYIVQVDVAATMGSMEAYLPYTAGVLAAAAWQSEIVKNSYCFKDFIFLRKSPDEVVAEMDNPGVVAFSCYCWNTEYNKTLAKKIKEKYPDCLTVFGGHNVPVNTSFLEQFAYIDILCFGEGEVSFTGLLEGIATDNLQNTKGIAIRNTDGVPEMHEAADYPRELNFPSPYLDGWFDSIMQRHPEIHFNAILETSRGCPNRCAYCDWGLLQSKTRQVPMEKVLAEIDWMADHQIYFVWGADANFGMFSRDLDIADALVKAKERTGFPERMRINYAKNSYDRVFKIIQKFNQCNFDRLGATLSFQSLSPVALENIGRENLSDEYFKRLIENYNENKMKTYSELILGLPGETYDSFTKGLAKIFDMGQHFTFDVYNCNLLPNSIMGQPEYVKKHQIKTTRTRLVRTHTSNVEFSIPEYNDIITETATMNREDIAKGNVFVYITKSMHAYGLIRVFAIYQRIVKNIPYDEFYRDFMDYLGKNPQLNLAKDYGRICHYADDMSRGINEIRLFMPFSQDILWEPDEYIVLNALQDREHFYEEITPFLKQFDYDDEIFDDLIQYQKAVVRLPNEKNSTVTLRYDIDKFINNVYLQRADMPEKRANRVTATDNDLQTNWPDFAKYVVWYGHLGWRSYKDEVKKELL